MNANLKSIYVLKGEAVQLKRRAVSAGERLTHGIALDLVARREGFKDWNALVASSQFPAGDANETKPTEVSGVVDGAGTISRPTSKEGQPAGAAIAPHFDATDGCLAIQPVEKLQRAYEYLTGLRLQGLAPVTRRAVRGRTFHDVVIEGKRFYASTTNYDPYIALGDGTGDCAFGVASISYCPARHGVEATWAVCKYGNQHHFELEGLSDAGRRALAVEFGLPIEMSAPDDTYFFVSPAYDSLVAWAKAHPRAARAWVGRSYLGPWHVAAQLDAGLKPRKKDLQLVEAAHHSLHARFALHGHEIPLPVDNVHDIGKMSLPDSLLRDGEE